MRKESIPLGLSSPQNFFALGPAWGWRLVLVASILVGDTVSVLPPSQPLHCAFEVVNPKQLGSLDGLCLQVAIRHWSTLRSLLIQVLKNSLVQLL